MTDGAPYGSESEWSKPMKGKNTNNKNVVFTPPTLAAGYVATQAIQIYATSPKMMNALTWHSRKTLAGIKERNQTGNKMNRILVANCGEIAIPIIRACRELEIWHNPDASLRQARQ